MKTLSLAMLALLAPLAVFAESTAERELSSHWDSLRFALGALTDDNYQEKPILVIYKTAEGGVLIVYNFQKITSRTLNESQVASIVSRLGVFFAGAGSSRLPGTERTLPALDMLLCIDKGFGRHSFFKSIDLHKEQGLVGEYSKYIDELSKAK